MDIGCCSLTKTFSKLNNSTSLSLSSQERSSIPLILFMAFYQTHSSMSMPFCAKDARSDAVLQLGTHTETAEEQNLLPQPVGHTSFCAAQDTFLASWAASAHCWVTLICSSTIPHPPISSPQNYSSIHFFCPACVCTSICTNPGAGTCAWPGWISWDFLIGGTIRQENLSSSLSIMNELRLPEYPNFDNLHEHLPHSSILNCLLRWNSGCSCMKLE